MILDYLKGYNFRLQKLRNSKSNVQELRKPRSPSSKFQSQISEKKNQSSRSLETQKQDFRVKKTQSHFCTPIWSCYMIYIYIYNIYYDDQWCTIVYYNIYYICTIHTHTYDIYIYIYICLYIYHIDICIHMIYVYIWCIMMQWCKCISGTWRSLSLPPVGWRFRCKAPQSPLRSRAFFRIDAVPPGTGENCWFEQPKWKFNQPKMWILKWFKPIQTGQYLSDRKLIYGFCKVNEVKQQDLTSQFWKLAPIEIRGFHRQTAAN